MSESTARDWSLPQRVTFRFAFAYLFLFFFPLPSGLAGLPFGIQVFEPFWLWFVPIVSEAAFGVTPIIQPTGSGDTTFEFVRLFCIAVIALITTVLWSILDRRRRDYRQLAAWSRIWLRYAVAIPMMGYGVAKVFPLQFSLPSVGRLWQTYGDSSPMGLLWTFMGASPAYTAFAGAGEVLGGVLLCFRRTTTLGALVVAGVMSNVAMLNFAYDVPVKIGSSHLLLGAIVLLLPDLRRLLDVFVLNRPVQPADLGPILSRRWLRWAAEGLRWSVLAFYFGLDAYYGWQSLKEDPRRRPLPAPNGYYQVESMKPETAATAAACPEWRYLSMRDGHVRIWLPDGTSKVFRMVGDPAAGPVDLVPPGDETPKAAPVGNLHIHSATDIAAQVDGEFEGRTISARLQRKEREDYLLLNRGFHWINELPYNR